MEHVHRTLQTQTSSTQISTPIPPESPQKPHKCPNRIATHLRTQN